MTQTSRLLRSTLAIISILGSSASLADERLKDIACRSVHLAYSAPEGDSFENEVVIQTSAPGTYFMVCGWDKGYFGLQELGNGKKLLIFSVWDSEQNNPNAIPEDRRTKVIHKDEKVRTGRFGGEGTGGQSFFDYDWKIGQPYRLRVSSKVVDNRTEYSGYFFVPETQEWLHLITFSTVTGGKRLSGYYAFIEDFKRNRESAKQVRQARFGHAFVLKDDSKVPITKARFTADANPVTNINAGSDGEYFFLATGGETKNDETKLREMIMLDRKSSDTPK